MESVQLVLVHGLRVGVWRFGSRGGWPLVWFHGGLSCGLDAKVIDDAARQRGADVISIDEPGIARSDHWTMPSISEWPQTVERIADTLGLDKFAVTGWSGGGPYALACAAAMPERVCAASTIAGMAPLLCLKHVIELGLWADRLLIPAAHWSPWLAAAVVWLARHAPDRFLMWEVRRLAEGSRDRAALESALQTLMSTYREATRRTVSGMVDEYRRYFGPWGFDFGDVPQPVTIWQGEHDTLVPMSHAHRLASLLPTSSIRMVPATGHIMPLAIPDEILEDLAP